MPVHVLSEQGEQKDVLPNQLTVIPLSQIFLKEDFTGKAVKGNVSWKGPLVSLAGDNFVIKIIIKGQDYTPSSINVILFGNLAKEFADVTNVKDVVVASGFTVGKSPTVHKDKLHPCNLLLKGDHAYIYVYSLSAAHRPSAAMMTTTKPSLQVSGPVIYTKLADLKAETKVNIYGVVVFFKPPHACRGTDLCSSVIVIDQSNRKISCTIFTKRMYHPQIFQIGDIIRLHGMKAQKFNDNINLINTSRFSALTLDGAVDRPIEPRTSSQTFKFDQDDCLIVEELRLWAATKGILPQVKTSVLSDVQPNTYFDLTCQLLAKARIDTRCILLRVWDGTRCPHKILSVATKPRLTDGPIHFPEKQEELIVDILAYDNHVEVGQQLKICRRGRLNPSPRHQDLRVSKSGVTNLLASASYFNGTV